MKIHKTNGGRLAGIRPIRLSNICKVARTHTALIYMSLFVITMFFN